MLSDKMLGLFNDQIGREHFSSNLYLQMSGWAKTQGLDGCAAFLRRHAEEEKMHMMKLFDFVLECGQQPIVEAVEKPESEYASVLEVFEKILDHEKHITGKIHELTDTAMSDKDYLAFNFLQWYVAEQHEEETLFSEVLEKVRMLGTEGRGLYMLDRDIGRIVTD